MPGACNLHYYMCLIANLLQAYKLVSLHQLSSTIELHV